MLGQPVTANWTVFGYLRSTNQFCPNIFNSSM